MGVKLFCRFGILFPEIGSLIVLRIKDGMGGKVNSKLLLDASNRVSWGRKAPVLSCGFTQERYSSPGVLGLLVC